MKFYLRYVNPVLALAVLVIGLMSASLEWNPIGLPHKQARLPI